MRDRAQRGSDANIIVPEIHHLCSDEHQLAIWWAHLWGDLDFSFEWCAQMRFLAVRDLKTESGDVSPLCNVPRSYIASFINTEELQAAEEQFKTLFVCQKNVSRKGVYVPRSQIPRGCITNDIYFLFKRALQVKYELDFFFFGINSWNSFPSSHCSCAWFPEPKQYGCTR